MSSRGPDRTEYPCGEFAGTLAIAVATEDHNQPLAMDSGDEHPVDLAHMIEKVGNDHQDVRTANLAEMGIIAPLGVFQFLQGESEIAEFGAPQVRQFKFANQVPVGNIEEVAKGDAVGQQRFLLKILSIDLDAVKQRCCQRDRGFQFGSPEVLDHHGRRRAVIGADVDKPNALPFAGRRMMIDNDIEIDFFETGQMIGLRVDHDLFAVIIDLDSVQPFDRDLQPFDHRDVVEAANFVGVGDDDVLDPVTEQSLDGHGTGQSVRIGIDHHKDVVILVEDIPECLKAFFRGLFRSNRAEG